MKFSVVIPYGNAEATIAACLDAALAAANRCGEPVEVLCVNGGSSDATAARVSSYAQKDGRVRNFADAPKTPGPGPARNAGIERAAGEYVVFVDADDALLPEALASLEDATADIVTYLPPTGSWDLTRESGRRALFSPLVGNLLAWNAAYRRAAIGGWRFPDLMNYEDLVWTAGMFARAKSVAAGLKPWYRHDARVPNSLANAYGWRRVRDGWRAAGMMRRACRGAHAGLYTRLVLMRKLAMHLLLHVAVPAVRAMKARAS